MRALRELQESPNTGTHLTNGSRQGTASAVPDSTQNSGVSTPEVRGANTPAIYKMGSGVGRRETWWLIAQDNIQQGIIDV
jgi:hypothetical protein